MKLVVGLGNPGRKYEGTRHNIGFRVLDELAAKLQAQKRQKQAFQADAAECQIGEEKVLLLWPQTFMNLSGGSVQPARDFYKLTNPDLLVICYDFNLPLGKLRIRKTGSSGGQKGLEDIIRRLGSNDITRLRIGIGTPPDHFENTDFVLGKFAKAEAAIVDEAVAKSVDAARVWVLEGADRAMAKYNG
jgi:peptidyl-tRNA hydrolase, PTH1 family